MIFLLGSIFAGLMLGLGVGLVIRAGASTGGMDIPPLILNKKFGLPVSIGLYVFDFTILIIQMSFRDKERILYGILLVLIYSTLVDKVLLMGKTQMQVKIISDHYEEINVENELKDQDSIYYFYKKLIGLRKEKEVIQEGTIEFFEKEDDDLLAYERNYKEEHLVVLNNLTERKKEVEIPQLWTSYHKLIGNYDTENIKENKVVLRPYETLVLEK